MGNSNKFYYAWFSSYTRLKCLILVVERDSRVGYRLNISYTLVIVTCLKVRREDAIFTEILGGDVCCSLIMLRVDECPNEDPGPLPGPR